MKKKDILGPGLELGVSVAVISSLIIPALTTNKSVEAGNRHQETSARPEQSSDKYSVYGFLYEPVILPWQNYDYRAEMQLASDQGPTRAEIIVNADGSITGVPEDWQAVVLPVSVFSAHKNGEEFAAPFDRQILMTFYDSAGAVTKYMIEQATQNGKKIVGIDPARRDTYEDRTMGVELEPNSAFFFVQKGTGVSLLYSISAINPEQGHYRIHASNGDQLGWDFTVVEEYGDYRIEGLEEFREDQGFDLGLNVYPDGKVTFEPYSFGERRALPYKNVAEYMYMYYGSADAEIHTLTEKGVIRLEEGQDTIFTILENGHPQPIIVVNPETSFPVFYRPNIETGWVGQPYDLFNPQTGVYQGFAYHGNGDGTILVGPFGTNFGE